MNNKRERALKELVKTFKTKKQTNLFIAYIKAVAKEHEEMLQEVIRSL